MKKPTLLFCLLFILLCNFLMAHDWLINNKSDTVNYTDRSDTAIDKVSKGDIFFVFGPSIEDTSVTNKADRKEVIIIKLFPTDKIRKFNNIARIGVFIFGLFFLLFIWGYMRNKMFEDDYGLQLLIAYLALRIVHAWYDFDRDKPDEYFLSLLSGLRNGCLLASLIYFNKLDFLRERIVPKTWALGHIILGALVYVTAKALTDDQDTLDWLDFIYSFIAVTAVCAAITISFFKRGYGYPLTFFIGFCGLATLYVQRFILKNPEYDDTFNYALSFSMPMIFCILFILQANTWVEEEAVNEERKKTSEAIGQLSKATAKNQKLQTENDDLKKEAESQKDKYGISEARNNDLSGQLSEATAKNRKLQTENDNLKKEAESQKDKHGISDARNNDLSNQLNQATAKNQKLQTENERLNAEINRKRENGPANQEKNNQSPVQLPTSAADQEKLKAELEQLKESLRSATEPDNKGDMPEDNEKDNQEDISAGNDSEPQITDEYLLDLISSTWSYLNKDEKEFLKIRHDNPYFSYEEISDGIKEGNIKWKWKGNDIHLGPSGVKAKFYSLRVKLELPPITIKRMMKILKEGGFFKEDMDNKS